MNCYVHPQANAIGTCMNCGKGICDQCATNVGGKLYCKNCLASGIPVHKSSQTNTLSIISLVVGIISVPLYFCYGAGIPFGIAAVITGYIGRNQIKESGGTQEGNGMATAGLVLGAIPLALGICAICVIAVLTLMGPVIGNVFSDIITGLGG